MRGMRARHFLALSAALLATAARPAVADTVWLKAGDTGEIRYPIENLPNDDGASLPVTVTATTHPRLEEDISQLAADLPSGSLKQLTLKYTVIDAPGTDGPVTVTLNPSTTLNNVSPSLSGHPFVATLNIDETPPALEVSKVQDSATASATDSGSGVQRFELRQYDQVIASLSDNPAVFSGLAEGVYAIDAFDMAGNVSSQTFSIGLQPPSLQLVADGNVSFSGSLIHSKAATVVAQSEIGLERVNVESWEGNESFALGGASSAAISLPNLTDGDYFVDAVDLAGNAAFLTFTNQLEPGVSVNAGRISIHDFHGTMTEIPTTLMTPFTDLDAPSESVFISASDQTGITHVEITATDDFGNTTTVFSDDPGAASSYVVPSAAVMGLAPGYYTVEFDNAALGTTLIYFRVVNMKIQVDVTDSNSQYDSVGGGFSASLAVSVNSDLPLDKVIRVDPASRSSIGEPKNVTGQTASTVTFTGFQISSSARTMVEFMARDSDGNEALLLFPTSVSDLEGAAVDFSGSDSTAPVGTFNGTHLIDPQVYASSQTARGLGGTGSFQSKVYDLASVRNGPFVPGAVMVLPPIDPESPNAFPVGIAGVTQEFLGYISGPASDGSSSQDVGFLSVGVGQGDSAETVSAPAEIVAGEMYLGGTSFVPSARPTGYQPLKRYFRYDLTLRKAGSPGFIVACQQYSSDGTTCLKGSDLGPAFTYVGPRIIGLSMNVGPETQGGAVFSETVPSGFSQTVKLGNGVTLSDLMMPQATVLSSSLNLGVKPSGAFSGYTAISGLYSIDVNFLNNGPVNPSSPFTVSLAFDASKWTAGQLGAALVLRLDDSGQASVVSASINSEGATFSSSQFGRFMVVAPPFKTPTLSRAGDLTFMANQAVDAVKADVASPDIAAALALIRSQGLTPVGDVYKLGPSGTVFNPPGIVTLPLPPEAGEFGSLIQFTNAGGFEPLAGLAKDTASGVITGQVNQFHSLFAVFVATDPVPVPDTAAPRTSLSFRGSVSISTTTGQVTLPPSTLLALQATDQNVYGHLTSGVATTYYLIDQQPVPGSAEGATIYSQTFGLSAGAHTVSFFSVDAAGNFEVPQSTSVFVASADTTPPTTTVTFLGQSGLDQSGGVVIAEDTGISLEAADSDASGGFTSGVAQTNYLVDQQFVSTSATPGQRYSQPFTLPLGAHSLTFYSWDQAGNYETPHGLTLTVSSTGGSGGGGGGGTIGVAPPSSFTIVSVASMTVTLAWSANGNPDGTTYVVFFGTATDAAVCAGGVSDQFPQTATTSFVSYGLLPATTYQFSVCATGGAGLCTDGLQVVTAPPEQGPLPDFAVFSCGGGGGGGGGPAGGTERGLGIGADANGRLWEVVNDGGAIGLARFANGRQDLAVELPNATDSDGAWSVRFDKAGNAYAVGTAQAPDGSFKDVAVYKVSASGVLVSTAMFHAGDTSKAVAWDANGDLWITGFVQDGNSNGTLTMGLWHYSIATGQLTETASYSRGGPADVGFGVRTLDNSIYVEGFTSTSPLSVPSLGRALWKFDGQGHGPVAGPFIDADYLRSLDQPIAARLEVASGTLYAAAPRTNDAGVNDLGFARYDANGAILSDHYVSFQDYSFTPGAIGLDAQQNVAVAASVSGPQGSGYGVARFAKDGGLIDVWAAGDSTAAVNGMAVLGNDLWLAIDGTTEPVRFVGGFQVPATDVVVSSGPVDTGPPVTQFLASGVTVSSGAVLPAGTTFTLSATDPPDGAGVASGVAETLYWIDLDPFACDADFDPAQPAGTCANPVYGGPFQLDLGTHTVSFQSTDAAGNSEELGVAAITVHPTGSPIAWTGAGGDSQWRNAANWSPSQVPGRYDTVVIDITGAIVVDSATSADFASLVLGDSNALERPTLQVSGTLLASAGTLLLQNGSTLVADTTQTMLLNTLTAAAGSTITQTLATVGYQRGVRLALSGDFTLSPGASVNLSGLGYSDLSGPGSGCLGGGGGGHGGLGGGGQCGNYGLAYDDLFDPSQPGSAGGQDFQTNLPGGPGGGIFVLNAAGVVTIDGVIDVSGRLGSGGNTGRRVGGGAGGAINIKAAAIRGTGSLAANGSGGTGGPSSGGGGGRVALSASGTVSNSLSIQAAGGQSVGSGANSTPLGGAGTIYIRQGNSTSLSVIGAIGAGAMSPTPMSSAIAVDSFTLSSAIFASTAVPQSLTVGSVLSLSSPYQLSVSTFIPPATESAFDLPQGCALSAGAIEAPPAWNWTVEGTLSASSLAANQVDVRGSASVAYLRAASLNVSAGASASASTITITGAQTAFNVAAGASLNAPYLVFVSSTDLSVAGTLASNHIQVDSLSVQPGGVVRPALAIQPLSITASSGVWIASGGALDAVGKGYPGAGATGLGPGAGQQQGGGGGHGGVGGAPNGFKRPAYDNPQNPTQAGSSGGGFNASLFDPPQPGSAGGGAILLSVGGTLMNAGRIDASGVDAPASPAGLGAGAGGTINISAGRISGSGVLRADGGDCYNIQCGSGGGGRIATFAAGVDSSSFTVTVRAGRLLASNNSINRAGEDGSLYRVPFVAVSADGVAMLSSHSSSEIVTAVSTITESQAYSIATSSQNFALATGLYDITPNGAIFSPPAILTFAFDPTLVDTATLAIYTFNGVAWDSSSITGQAITVLSPTSGQITGVLAHASLYGAFYFQPDRLPPRTTLTIGEPRVGSSQVYITTETPVSLLAVDDKKSIGDGIGLGVARTMVSVDSAAFSVYAGAFTLGAEGAHAVRYYSVDFAGNAEDVRVSSLAVDATAPESTATPGAPSFTAEDGTLFVSSTTPLALTATDGGPAPSGVARVEYSVDGGAFAVYASSLTFAEGPHRLAYRAVDNLGLTEATRTLAVQSDATPPATTLQTSGTFYLSGGQAFAPASFTYALEAEDFVSSGLPAGVALSRYALDGGAFTVSAGTFSLSQGVRDVAFYSADKAGNVELVKSATIYVDAAPPVSSLAAGSPSFDAGGGRVFVSSATPLSLSAEDAVVAGVASGVESIAFRRGGDAFAPYASSFTLAGADGAQEVDWFAADHVGNVESTRTASFLLDDTAPQSSLALLGGRRFPGPDGQTVYASSDTRIALVASDPPAGGAAAGVALTLWQENSGSTHPYTAPLSLAEGAHALAYRSQDNVGNLEVVRSTNILVDATPPASVFAIGSPYFKAADGTSYVTPATPVTFTATDPALPSGQPGSGVASIEVSVDGAPFAAYGQALTFAAGRHTVAYRSVDSVGNVEATRTLSLQSDATPPVTALGLSQGHQFPGPDLASFFASPDTRFGFSAADPVVSSVASGVAATRWGDNGGAEQVFTAPVGLAEGIHHLAYESQDNVGNLEVSRSTTALVDATPPLTQLAIVGGRQFAGPDGSTFYASSGTRLALGAADPVSNGVASGLAGTRWQDNGSVLQTYVSSIGLSEGAHKLSYQSQDNVANLEVPRSTNVWVDATAPASAFAFGTPYYQAADGTNYVTPATPLVLSAADPNLPSGQPGSGVSRIEYSLDGAPFTQYAAPLTFAEGRHALLFRAVDNVGNVEAARALALQSDATPPASTLVFGQPQYPLPGGLLISSRTAFSITAVDPAVNNVASGVKDTYYRVSDVSLSSAALAAFTTPFTMSGPDGTKVIQFYSRDNVLNAEAVKSGTVLLDAAPPEVALLSPAGCDAGICRVLKGRFPVLGTARDAHFARYLLEAAAGQGATSGFALVSSGTLAVSSGTLGVWDAGKLSGWQTLRLTATDLVQNVSALSLDVWVGDPAALMTLGNHDTFNMPTGVAVSSSGAIYVADRGANRVAIFSSTGALLAAFGGPGHDSDDHRVSSATLRLHEPAGVAVDAAGDVFVADTDNNRVLEISPFGQVLLTLGRAKAKRDHDQGSAEREEGGGPGEFRQPFGVAVDGAGSIYVADTGNHRVQIFSSSGVFVAQFALPAVARTHEESERDEDADDAGLGRPVAVALDAAGRIYIADPAGHRVLVYTSTGALPATLPITGDGSDALGTPDGVAVSPSGDCLLVSDKKLDRVLKFDLTGVENLAFGEKGNAGGKKAPSAIVFRKPAGLALDAAGNLYVADRNNESIKKLGLPDGRPTLVVPPPADDLAAKDVVDHDAGGTVAREDKAAVAIPPQALPKDLKITVAPPAPGPDDNSRRLAQQDNQLKAASPPVDFGPEGTKFAVPATLTIPYDPQLVAAQGVVENDLKINYWNPAKQQWEAFDSTVDKANHTVTAKTSHFSLYQVLSSTPGQVGVAGGPVADPTFMVHAAYAFPNPAVRGAKPTIHVAVGVADEVKITILNVAGQQVAHGELYGTPQVIDDGSGPQYAYEWVWDGHIASGMYFYVVEASKSGYPKIRKAGKLGVVR